VTDSVKQSSLLRTELIATVKSFTIQGLKIKERWFNLVGN